jgi:hypothetical protein
LAEIVTRQYLQRLDKQSLSSFLANGGLTERRGEREKRKRKERKGKEKR